MTEDINVILLREISKKLGNLITLSAANLAYNKDIDKAKVLSAVGFIEILPTNEEKIAYHYSTGLTSRQVASHVGVHFTTITSWWKSWGKVGIAECIPVKRGIRYKRVFSLEDFDIAVPPSRKVNVKNI